MESLHKNIQLMLVFLNVPFLVLHWTRVRRHLLISMLEKLKLVSFDQSNNNGSIDVKKDGFVLEEISCFTILGLTFSSKLDWGSYILYC